MFNNIIKIIKKYVFCSFLLYGYNLISVSLGIIIPINLITLSLLVFVGYESLFSLILIQILIY